MHVRKALPGGASGGYYWENPGDVLEIPDWLGEQLLEIRNGGFSEVFPEDEFEEAPETPEDEGQQEQDPGGDEESLTPGQKAARTRAANKAAAEAAASQE